ncbi:hypothetical protein [Sulfurimonas sp.]|uniref:hypothetical protein n=1 Tax=Sulfurimonas sp. TaxID=2022749 RepID=UPI002B4664D8|nr:hypothetical protein [Sulfurimonas sp.]
MAKCNTFYKILRNIVIFYKLSKGYEMSIIINNAQSLFERFENSIEMWAKKVF